MSQKQKQKPLPPPNGQALVEYALILALVILGFGLAMAATGPTIANVFSNTVFNLVSREQEKIPTQSGAPGTPQYPPDSVAFWKTVTAVASITPAEVPMATSTSAPPTNTPTPGSPPPPTNTLPPSKTPSPTPITPTPVPTDVHVDAPWTDTANIKEAWRLDETNPFGPDDWYGKYFNHGGGTPLTGSIFQEGDNGAIDPAKKQVLQFDWQGNSPKVGGPTDNFSATWYRTLMLDRNMQVTFTVPFVDDSIRIWLEGSSINGGGLPGCSAIYKGNGTWVYGGDTQLGYNPVADPTAAGAPKDCLIMENWTGSSSSGGSVTRTLKQGTYTVHVDYAEKSGSASISVGISSNTSIGNPDDAALSGGVAVTGANANCDWGNPTGLEKFADTPDKLWTSYEPDSAFRGQRRCYLEFRGSIGINKPSATQMVNPVLTFWDLWDFRAGTTAWVEIAEYKTMEDRKTTPLVWEKFPLHANDGFNYNWTYQSIAIPTKYIGKDIALRFGIENTSTTDSSRWWVDTIGITDVTRKTFSTLMNFTDTKQGWDLNDQIQKKDFITTGSWGLTTENAIGGSGLNWHESPETGIKYTKIDTDRGASTDNGKYRIHSLEFNGFIDLDGSPVDVAGDTGDPELVFYQSYDVANLTGLEIQYTLDPYSAGNAANWVTVGTPFVSRTSTTNTTLAVTEERRINLKPIGDAAFTKNSNRKFRLRFAMLVDKASNADKSGWWIDEISIQRVDRPRFHPYPFMDTMETPVSDTAWQSLGTWGREEGGQNPAAGTKGYSFTDSPGGKDYDNNDKSVLELRYPIDLRSDTKINPRAQNCALPAATPCDGTRDKPAVNPMMTFWWKHEFGSGENFYVEWKLKRESSTSWRVLWAYNDGAQTVGTSQRISTRVSKAWERVEIDMKPVTAALANNAGEDDEDDIVVRFNLTTNGSSTGPGVWVDNVNISDRLDTIWYLWPTSETRKDVNNADILSPAGTPAKGSGTQYINSGEDINVFPPEWYVGGNWQPITWETHDGLNAFHDSVDTNGVTQSKAEIGYQNPTLATTQRRTFNVLELNTIFDLRGVNAIERPILYFWSRYHISANAKLIVQVSTEKTPAPTVGAAGPCMNSYQQCYEKMFSWNEWQDVWSISGEKVNLAWNREQVNLTPFTKNGLTAGSRIRIRFVVDALDASQDYDGWYLDQFAITYYTERRIPITPSSSFVDNSTDMANWIGEGEWGLDPELYRGGGGAPIQLGPSWSVNYWSFAGTTGTNRCKALNTNWNNTDKFPDCAKSFFEPSGNDTKRAQSTTYHRPNSGGIARDQFGLEIEVFHEWAAGGPFGYTDAFAGRWELVTPVTGSPGSAKGKITFIMASDDGARLRYINEQASNQTVDACVNLTSLCGQTWNIIDNFYPAHGRMVNVGTAILAVAGAGGNNNTSGKYRFILEYYEKNGDATLTLATGTDTFSFSDTPKQGSGSGFPEVPAIRNASSSLILNGVLDLTNAVKPYLTYYTYYELGGYARVEVTTDGGFTWVQTGLRGRLDNAKWADASWAVQMWNDTDLDYTGSATPNYTTTTTSINYNWGTGVTLNNRADNLSLRFTRKINLTTLDKLNITTTADDGVRLWIYKVGDTTPMAASGCRTGGNGGTQFIRSGAPTTGSGLDTYTDGCLLIDNWRGQGATSADEVFTPPSAGTYVIQLDYYEGSSDASLKLDISPANFDVPYFGGTWMPTNDWQFRVHDLSDYQGQRIGLRFRLDRLGNAEASTKPNITTQSPYNYLISWWLTEISVFSN